MTCSEREDLERVIAGGYPSPEMVELVRVHKAICVRCGGEMPGPEDLQAIFRDMFTRVGHADICKDDDCKCDDDPPSQFEIEVVRQFRKEAQVGA